MHVVQGANTRCENCQRDGLLGLAFSLAQTLACLPGLPSHHLVRMAAEGSAAALGSGPAAGWLRARLLLFVAEGWLAGCEAAAGERQAGQRSLTDVDCSS